MLREKAAFYKGIEKSHGNGTKSTIADFSMGCIKKAYNTLEISPCGAKLPLSFVPNRDPSIPKMRFAAFNVDAQRKGKATGAALKLSTIRPTIHISADSGAIKCKIR
jgi:hypothetical protein